MISTSFEYNRPAAAAVVVPSSSTSSIPHYLQPLYLKAIELINCLLGLLGPEDGNRFHTTHPLDII
jgi:hypothetical protein